METKPRGGGARVTVEGTGLVRELAHDRLHDSIGSTLSDGVNPRNLVLISGPPSVFCENETNETGLSEGITGKPSAEDQGWDDRSD